MKNLCAMFSVLILLCFFTAGCTPQITQDLSDCYKQGMDACQDGAAVVCIDISEECSAGARKKYFRTYTPETCDGKGLYECQVTTETYICVEPGTICPDVDVTVDPMNECGPEEKSCQIDYFEFVCVGANENCPPPTDRGMPHCGPGERLCQTGSNDYTCVDSDEDCPDPDGGHETPDCDDDERLCQTGADDYECVPYGQPCD